MFLSTWIQQYADLFDKIDITGEGTVDWDKFASHILLEFYEKDDRIKTTNCPQWRELRTLASPHKDVIQGVMYLKHFSRYLSVGWLSGNLGSGYETTENGQDRH
ncbi:unnamed protein product [Protopolystoma xenopodis]|uniref:EF-hand domain-containing protein n=1 Tax=Protopolystoma xenopodis TaxID=117903 RepID=A0A448WQE7_9PLAT|nr:unnamed protein product [Protopolystoma xenopodis]